MSKIQVLPLDYWMDSKHSFLGLRDEIEEQCESVTPVFHRDGWYRVGNKCWFETDGKAYTDKGLLASFTLRIDILSVPCLTEEEVAALRVLRRARLLSNQQRKMLEMYDYRAELRAIRLGVARRMVQFRRRK